MKGDDIRHGTYAGYQRHRLYGIPACDDCMAASKEYARRYRLSTRYRRDKRNTYARNKTLTALREMAPDLYHRLYEEAAREWEQLNPEPERKP